MIMITHLAIHIRLFTLDEVVDDWENAGVIGVVYYDFVKSIL